MAGMKLYETVDALSVIRDWLDEHDDEIKNSEGVLPDALADLLEQAEGDFKQKIERVALFIREQEHYGKMAKAEKDRLSARQSSFENRVKRLKDFYLKPQLERAKQSRVDCDLLSVRIQKNTVPSVTTALPAKELWDQGSTYVKKISTTIERHGEEPETSDQYVYDNDLIKAAVKANAVTNEELEAIGITVAVGTHVRIA